MQIILLIAGAVAYIFFLKYLLRVRREIKAMKRETKRIIKETRSQYKSSVRKFKKCHSVTERRVIRYTRNRRKILNSSIKKFVEDYKKVKHIKLHSIVPEESLGNLDTITNVETVESLSKIKDNHLKDKAAAGIDTVILIMVVEMVGTLIFSFLTAFLFVYRTRRRAEKRLSEAEELRAKTLWEIETHLDGMLGLDAIREYADILEDLLNKINKLFAKQNKMFRKMIRKREGFIFKKKLTQADFTDEDIELMSTTRALAGVIKAIIDTKILDEYGRLSYEAQEARDQSEEAYELLTGR